MKRIWAMIVGTLLLVLVAGGLAAAGALAADVGGRGMAETSLLRVTDETGSYWVADPTHLPACEDESSASDDCYWSAADRGNGQGRSFYVLDGVVTYL